MAKAIWETYGRDKYAQMVKYLKAQVKKGDKGASCIAMKSHIYHEFGVSVSASRLRELRLAIRNGESIDAPAPDAQKEFLKIEGDQDNREIESLSARLTTVEEVLAKAQVDLSEWEAGPCKIKYYEMGSKGPDNKPCVTPLCSIAVSVKRKVGWTREEFRALLIKDLEDRAPDYAKLDDMAAKLQVCNPTPKQPLLCEISIFDAHFGKLAWKEECGANYDLKICEKRYMAAGRDLLQRAADKRPERILFVAGNDFFHTDQGRAGLTTNGTAQDTDGRWQKAFRKGKDCLITLIEEASLIAPVDVIVVPGNHDAEKCFCLGEVLKAYFKHSKTVHVTNEADTFSYYRFGVNLLGFVHGDTVTADKKRAELPATMATDRPRDWAETICREWHLGHLHSENEMRWFLRTVEMVRDVAVRILPSLSSSDGWHRRNNYKSILAAEMHVYHKTRGRYGYEVHQTTE